MLMAKSCGLLLLLAFALSSSSAYATQFKVGGSRGWSLPDPDAMSFNQWAQRNRFHVGDSLLFVYPKDKDSVLEVDQNAYDTCNTSTYINKYDDGNTVFKFTRSGAFYFISGVESNCLRNESLVILVMANRTNRHQLSPSASPPAEAPTPTPSSSSYPPPPSEALEPSPSPSPPPSPPSPPPSPSEVTPAAEPAPAGEEPNNPPPPPNGAASRVVGFMGLVGPLFGPAFFLFFL
ncbi:early nodulin-like protein 18 [Curcuma longa]|uniref:early nodulin-like protein 18 n=1 Tax=Curcuma longa TaxID=136217 RepID=UPI003D9F2CCA